MIRSFRWFVLCTLFALWLFPQSVGADEPVKVWGDDPEWRVHWTIATVLMEAEDEGYDNVGRGRAPENQLPPEGWMARDFDDSQWGYACTFLPGRGEERAWQVSGIHLRRWLKVTDPDQVHDLTLHLVYRGGVVVYVNGREVGRAHLPEGSLPMPTIAQTYSEDAFFGPDGSRLGTHMPADALDEIQRRYALRVREARVTIPASALKQGDNVIAVGIYRPAYPRRFIEDAEHWSRVHHSLWSMTGLNSASLIAASASGHKTVADLPPTRLWHATPLTVVGRHATHGDPCAPLRPLSLSLPRNAVASGPIVVAGVPDATNLRATVTDLVSEDGTRLTADHLTIRYAVDDEDETQVSYDILSPTAPRGQSIVPIWLTVHAPTQTQPGVYRGMLRVTGLDRPLEAPVEVRVHAWQSPDPRDFTAWSGLFQSAHSLAERFAVAMWSDEHFALIEQSMKYLGKVGNKIAAIPAQRDMSMLRGDAMLLFKHDDQGRIIPDLRLVERYLRLYDKHVGQPRVLILHAWTADNDPRRGERPGTIPVSMLRGDQIVAGEIPNFGQPGSEEIWRRVVEAMRELAIKLQWHPDCLMLGTPSDARPSDETLAMFHRAAEGVRWVVYSHHAGPRPRGVDIYPARHGRGPFGWRVEDPYRLTNHRGILHQDSATARYRIAAIYAIKDGFNGVSGKGIDFIRVPRADGGTWERFVDMREWMRVVRGATRAMVAPGPEGLLATTRFEMYREGFQDAEAFIFIENHKDDERLGPELAAQAQTLRRRLEAQFEAFTVHGFNPDNDWRSYQDELYELAHAVHRAIYPERPR